MKIENQVAVVTGASGGIGQAICEKFAEKGARGIAVVDMSSRCIEVAGSINQANGRTVAKGFQGDVTNPEFRESVYSQMQSQFGLARICIPAAGILRDGMAVKMPKDSSSTQAEIYPESLFRQTLEVNLMHPAYWTMQMLAGIAEYRHENGLGPWRKGQPMEGVAILVGSVSSRGNRGQVSYSAAKSGLNAVCATLNHEGLFYGVQTKIIHPGFVSTPMTESMPDHYFEQHIKPLIGLGRMIAPEEIADAVVALVENPAISGQLWADASLQPLI